MYNVNSLMFENSSWKLLLDTSLAIQQSLGYPTLVYSKLEMTVLLEYFEYRYGKFIRAFQQSSVYKCMGFSYPNNSLI